MCCNGPSRSPEVSKGWCCPTSNGAPRNFSTTRTFRQIERKTREQLADSSDQFGGQSLRADDRLTHGIACEKAKHGDGARGRHPMAIGALVIRLAIVLVDDEFEQHR